MSSEDQIHESVTVFDLLDHGRLLHHAAAQCDLHVRIFPLVAV